MMTLPIDPESQSKDEQARALQNVKSAFLDGDTSAVIVSLIAEPLARFEQVRRQPSPLKRAATPSPPSTVHRPPVVGATPCDRRKGERPGPSLGPSAYEYGEVRHITPKRPLSRS